MGGVIFSAVIILGGTFAAMMPAGVLSLLEIATVVLIGLVLYAVVILPLFVPVMVKLFGRGNWWPFITRKGDHQENVPPKNNIINRIPLKKGMRFLVCFQRLFC